MRNGCVAGLGQPGGMPGRLVPVLAQLVVHVRRRPHADSGGEDTAAASRRRRCSGRRRRRGRGPRRAASRRGVPPAARSRAARRRSTAASGGSRSGPPAFPSAIRLRATPGRSPGRPRADPPAPGPRGWRTTAQSRPAPGPRSGRIRRTPPAAPASGGRGTAVPGPGAWPRRRHCGPAVSASLFRSWTCLLEPVHRGPPARFQVGDFGNGLHPDVEGVEEPARGRRVRRRLDRRDGLRGVQRVDQDVVRAAGTAERGQIREVREVADPPGTLGPHGIQLRGQAPAAALQQRRRRW